MVQGEASSVSARRAAGLSRRQSQVLELLADGIPAREIALRLDLAETTVRNHIRHLLKKLDCHSQLEAVAVAYRLELLDRPGMSAVASLPTSAATQSSWRSPRMQTSPT